MPRRELTGRRKDLEKRATDGATFEISTRVQTRPLKGCFAWISRRAMSVSHCGLWISEPRRFCI